MRVKALVAVVAVAAAALGVGLLTPAAGQAPPSTFTVVKVVEGPVPDGAVFEVTVTCEAIPSSPPSEGFVPVTFQFDQNGDPIGDNSIEIGLFVDCTAEETVTNGATVTYACAVTIPNGSPPADGEGDPAGCLDDQTVRIAFGVDIDSTITVTNTFEEVEPPPPPVVDDDDDVIDDNVVTATPPFTG